MTTNWDEEFASIKEDETEFYPGSNRPIIRHPNRVPDPVRRGVGVDPDWDDKPKVYTINGEDIEFFTVGQLAKALGREPGTMRKWENLGVIPKATFQVPGKDGDVRGRRRLYSRKQVEGMVRIAEEEGMLANTRKPFQQTKFKERVLELFKATATAA